ncbi:hypothetical protein [Thermanaeromonas toyohensis]|nr:hypothetical protein [Thermanaeromonas toyohensis]
MKKWKKHEKIMQKGVAFMYALHRSKTLNATVAFCWYFSGLQVSADRFQSSGAVADDMKAIITPL